ncbi:hypothetical protein I302_103484 [Kwoniella bestiolae CBS 10118]|uniref:Uncharacterized protein n=1 Tax=Kwoniella bestiolae CBS 10118 TaxID=1296100 RepID=A0A1B9G8H8_9TREE|nr:hypothetical protein I302_02185 [Kwoniella bestiolae CBS 10118]OCF27344.1 hypothetical protein I302_02185 [Kwoniella bestiolae CBS 10118]
MPNDLGHNYHPTALEYPMDWVNYKIRIENSPTSIWQFGRGNSLSRAWSSEVADEPPTSALATTTYRYIFRSPMKIVISAHTTEGPVTDPEVYTNLLLNITIVNDTPAYSPLFSVITLPLFGVVKEERQGQYVGTAEVNGFMTNLPNGTYHLVIEVLDRDIMQVLIQITSTGANTHRGPHS